MERIDSASTGMASLIEMYEERSDDDNSPSPSAPSAVDNISDEDENDKESSAHSSRPPSRPTFEDMNSSSPLTFVKPTLKKKTTRLVSYGPDADEEEDESDTNSSSEEEEEEVEIGSEAIIVNNDINPDEPLDSEQASSLSRSVQNKTADEIELPPEPQGKCPKALQDKITKMYDKMLNQGMSLNYMNNKIKQRKDYRNPSIYEKLIEFCGIDEKGTNYPPEMFDPHQWGKESFYDALDKAQKTEMEKREKERKDRTKIEFVTGTKKAGSDAGPDEKKRKSKWDSLPQVTGTRPGVVNPTAVASLTVSATGTKSTVIPAVGNITKKSKS